MNKVRPSVYLEDKCKTFETLLDYFLAEKGSFNKTVNEKLLAFLYQIDFWDWEIENLIFSFDNFEERSQAWQGSANSNVNAIWLRHGLPIKSNLVSFWKDYSSRYYKGEKVVAPVKHLNKVIDKWNKLLDRCVDRVFMEEKTIQSAIEMKAQILPNLDKYKKSLRRETEGDAS
jgi:hypothetical protein